MSNFSGKDWLIVAVVVVALFLGTREFLGSVVGLPDFTYSSFTYSADEPLAGDVMVGKHFARVGPLHLNGDFLVEMKSPEFVCDLNEWIALHDLTPPRDFSDVGCWETEIVFEDEVFRLHPGESKIINSYLSITYDVSGPVVWSDFKCLYEVDGVKVAEPVSCTASMLDQRFYKGWVGNLDFFVDLENGFNIYLKDPKVNLQLNVEHQAEVIVEQKVFKKVDGGVKLLHTSGGLYMKPKTLMQEEDDLVFGNNSVPVFIPTSGLGEVISDMQAFIRIQSPHLVWTGLSQSVITKEYDVKQEQFFEGIEEPTAEFMTKREVVDGVTVVGEKKKVGLTWLLFLIIIGFIVIFWYVAFRRKR